MPHAIKQNSPLSIFFKESISVVLPKKGDVLNAVYIGRTKQAYYFDLDKMGTGVVYGLEALNANDILKTLTPGASILAKIMEQENEEGCAELSISETTKHKAWQDIKELQDRGEPITVTIQNANSGGLIAEMNELKAFLPVSQLSPDHYPRVHDGDRAKILEELKRLIGQQMIVKIIDFNPRTNKLIISERGILDENTKEQLAKYKPGDVVSVIVSGIADFGVFVKIADNPSIEGLIHVSELDHRLIDDPRQVVTINDLFEAQIVEIKEGRVSLSLKALKVNPWDTVAERYHEGQEVHGIVHRFNQLGASIALDDDFHALVRATAFGGVEEMKKALPMNTSQTFIIESIKPAEKRIMLKPTT